MDTEEVNGGVVRKGVKLSLFDVSDPENPKEQAVLVLGDQGTLTEVSYEHKAFMYHAASGLIALPVDLHQLQQCKQPRTPGGTCPNAGSDKYSASTFQGAYIIYMKNDTNGKMQLTVHGRVSHERTDAGANAADTSSLFWGGWGGWRESLRRIYRSVYMDGLLYTISDRHLQVHKLDTLMKVATLNITYPTCVPAKVWAEQDYFGGVSIGRPMP